MRTIYLVSVWLHILAATAWIGGMFFLVLVVVPWMRSGGRKQAGTFLRETGVRFRAVGWACFGLLLTTGSVNLWARGVRPGDFARPEWLGSPFGKTVLAKLATFALVLVVSVWHDFIVGPMATAAIARASDSAEAEALRRRASVLGRLNAMLSLVLVALAVMLVRGPLW